jgi:hypothetical protein
MSSFFLKSPLGMILGLISSLLTLLVLIVLITGVLAYTGGPGACTPGGGAIEISDAQAASFDQKWDQLDASLDGGAPTAISLTESEISSRAAQYIRDHSGDISDVRVCVHDGQGEVTGKVDALLGKIKFKAAGTVDLTSGHPVAEFDDISVGNVPGFILGLFEGIVESAIEELLEDIGLSHTYTPGLSGGSAEIQGTP